MIVEMVRVRALGPRARLEEVLEVIQDVGVLHLAPPVTCEGLAPVALDPARERELRHLRALLEDLERVLAALPVTASAGPLAERATITRLARWARWARRLARRIDALDRQERELEDERALLLKYRQLSSAFEPLLARAAGEGRVRAYHLLLEPRAGDAMARLRVDLEAALGPGFEIFTKELDDGRTAFVLIVPEASASHVEGMLDAAGVEPVPVPEAYGGGRSLAEALPRMRDELRRIPGRLDALRRERAELARRHGAELARARASVRDRLLELEALPLAAQTGRAFVLEGWIPEPAVQQLEDALAGRVEGPVSLERLARETWSGEGAPVVLRNPRIFRPFEAVTRLLPLPAYGSLDPTPFVAVFFPLFFGMILGDIGYGCVLALVAAVLGRRSRPGGTGRALAKIAAACAAFTVVFGGIYGELFGDLGHRWLGLPALFGREEAIVPFLGFAVALGCVHVLLGMVLGVVSAFRVDRRRSLGRGIAAVMVVLVILALLAAFEVLPAGLLTPAVVALLAAFPLLVLVEGIVGPIELLATLGNILSYARIMAVGTASVMLAVAANRLGGAFGSALVGTLFALLFHLVNFVLGVFSPAVHSLRLHYVEFFGQFFSPGGVPYRPLARWRPELESAA